jgi:hypothetical protein
MIVGVRKKRSPQPTRLLKSMRMQYHMRFSGDLDMSWNLERNNMHWNYFLALEADILHLSRFVEPREENMRVFSIELTRLLLAIGSEADVVSKLLVAHLTGGEMAMRDRREALIRHFPWLLTTSVRIPRYNFTIEALKNWDVNSPLSWWEDYNSVKHRWSEEYSKANLKNVLDALTGLFIFDLVYCRCTGADALMPAPVLLYPPPELGSIAICPDGQLVDLRACPVAHKLARDV